MEKVRLGKEGPFVSVQGLGCMGMSIAYGEPNDEESIATINLALDLGVNLIVTSDAYGNGANEELIARAIKSRRSEAIIATKFGNLALAGVTLPEGLSAGHPDYVFQACEASLRRLRMEEIDIYGLHRVDPKVPIEETVGAMKRLVEEGKVRYLALSEAGAETIRRAQAIHPICAVETEYSLWSRDAESEIIPTCRKLGIGYLAYAPLGRGFLTATIKSPEDLRPTDRRRQQPRFVPENLQRNLTLLAPLEKIASERGCTPGQIALAWLHSKGRDIVPIPGTKRRSYLRQNAAAAEIRLTEAEMAALEEAFSPGVAAGTRYPEKQLSLLGI